MNAGLPDVLDPFDLAHAVCYWNSSPNVLGRSTLPARSCRERQARAAALAAARGRVDRLCSTANPTTPVGGCVAQLLPRHLMCSYVASMDNQHDFRPSPPSVRIVRELLPIGEIAPERYVALNAHGWYAASIFSYRYPDDAEVDEFCRQVNALLNDHGRWEELRREWLTPEEHQKVLEEERAQNEGEL